MLRNLIAAERLRNVWPSGDTYLCFIRVAPAGPRYLAVSLKLCIQPLPSSGHVVALHAVTDGICGVAESGAMVVTERAGD